MASVQEKIDRDVKDNKIILYMKGTPDAPQCGFSAQVAAVLKHYGVQYKSVNVLEDEEVRQGIKEYSDWPTIPQLYVSGQFIGGCDIVTELHSTGELKKLLQA